MTSPPGRQRFVIGRVDLPAVAMALLDHVDAVGLRRDRARLEIAGLCAESHRRAQVGHVLLLGQQVDHRMLRRRVELRGVGALEAADVSGELDDRALQAQADAEERHAALARVAHRVDLPLDTAHAESARDQDTVHVGESRLGRIAAEVVGGDPVDAHIGAVEEPAVEQRLDDGEIGVAQIHVLPDDRDVDGIGRGVDAIDQIRPFAQIGLALDTQMLGQQVVQPLAVEHERDLIDRGGVGSAHHTARSARRTAGRSSP